MKALIIGGGGFVGPYLVNHLHDDLGYEVAVTKTAKEQLALSNAVVYDCDILNKSEITDVLETVRPGLYFSSGCTVFGIGIMEKSGADH